jgi:hypothetical protein
VGSGTILRMLAITPLLVFGHVVAHQQGSVATFGTTVFSSAGLIGRIYFISENSAELPRFHELQSVGAIYTPSLNVPPQHWMTGFPGVTERFEWFAIDYHGNFWIDKADMYRFALTSDDGAALWIDDQQIIDNDGQHPPQTRFSSLELARGFHRLRVPYFQGPRETVALVLQIAGPGETFRVFSTDEFKPPASPDDWAQTGGAPPDRELAPSPEKDIPSNPVPKFTSTVLIGGGLTGRVYRASRRTWRVPDLTNGTPLDTFYSPTVSLPERFRQPIAIRYEGNFWIESAGLYRFAVIAEDGAKLSIDGQLIDDNDQPHDFQRNRRSCSLRLGPGAHSLQLLYFHRSKSKGVLTVLAARPGENFREFTTQEFAPPHNLGAKPEP